MRTTTWNGRATLVVDEGPVDLERASGSRFGSSPEQLFERWEEVHQWADAADLASLAESGTATGWAFTDWVEEMVLRTTSPENYDKWVTNDLKFNSPEIKTAIGEVTKIWFDDKNVYGGRKTIATTGFGDAPTPMFAKPSPKCWLHKQGNFITSFFPKDVKEGVDYDFFYLPGVDPKYGSPVLVAGDLMTMFNDRPEVRALMQYFTSAEHLKVWL